MKEVIQSIKQQKIIKEKWKISQGQEWKLQNKKQIQFINNIIQQTQNKSNNSILMEMGKLGSNHNNNNNGHLLLHNYPN